MARKTRSPRRTWSTGFKKRVVAEASQPGVSAAQIARRYDLNANLLFNWKKKFGAGGPLLPVEIVADGTVPVSSRLNGDHDEAFVSQERNGHVEIALPNGIKVRCSAQIDPTFVGKIVTAVRSKS
jgi:transposase